MLMSLNHSQPAFYMVMARAMLLGPGESVLWLCGIQVSRPGSTHKHKSIVNHSTRGQWRPWGCAMVNAERWMWNVERWACNLQRNAICVALFNFLQRDKGRCNGDIRQERQQELAQDMWLAVAFNYPNANLVLIRTRIRMHMYCASQ